MTGIERTDRDRVIWIGKFRAYVVHLRPSASFELVEVAAAERYARLGEFDAIEVADAELHSMVLGDQPSAA